MRLRDKDAQKLLHEAVRQGAQVLYTNAGCVNVLFENSRVIVSVSGKNVARDFKRDLQKIGVIV